MASNTGYWKDRMTQMDERLLNRGEAYIDALERHYETAVQTIEGEINVFYQRFAINNELTFADATTLLNSAERKRFQMTLDEYIKKGIDVEVSGKWIKELESASNIYHIDRLKALQIQMRNEVEMLAAHKQRGMKALFSGVYEDSYYETIFEAHQYFGEGSAFTRLGNKDVERALAMTYDSDGLNYSGKIWKDRNYLAYTLEKELPQMIARGEAPKKLIDLLAKRFDTSKHSAGTLVLTESAFLIANGQKESYTELGVEEYEIVATLDSVTSAICQEQDGKHYPMADFEVWVSAPPFHHRCRSTTVPYFDDEFTVDDMRAARGADGKTYYVPADMKYKQWKVEHVADAATVKERGLFNEYRAILGKNAPKSIEDFLKIRYNKNDWKEFSAYAKSVKSGEITPLADFSLYQEISKEIDSKLVGITTANGITVTDKSNHFIARVIGSAEQRRSGVYINEAMDALANPSRIDAVKENKNNNSQRFISDLVAITINPDTGLLIQVNPRRRKKKV